MNRILLLAVFLTITVSSYSQESPVTHDRIAAPASVSGERLAYLIGCVNCHHQTPKEILNAPPLVIVKNYSLAEFKTLLNTGVTRDGRDMYAQGSIMGIIAREQLSYFTDAEVVAVYDFLQNEWTAERGATEEAKIRNLSGTGVSAELMRTANMSTAHNSSKPSPVREVV